MEFTGFELSPASTHMAVAKIKTRTQAEVNRELAAKWAREMTKRNEYFCDFGIATITFTDTDLADMDACFAQLERYLRKRPRTPLSLEAQIEELLRA